MSCGGPPGITRGRYEVIHNLHDHGQSEPLIASSGGLPWSSVRRVFQGHIASMVTLARSEEHGLLLAPVDIAWTR